MKKIRDFSGIFRETMAGLALLLIFIFLLTSCATSRHALTGAAIGGIVGTVVCKGNPNCGWIGAALGAAIGNEADQVRIEKQHEDYWKKRLETQKAAAENAVQIIEVDEDTEVIFVNEEGKIQKY